MRAWRPLLVLLGFSALAVAHTWPLGANVSRTVLGGGDASINLWAVYDLARQMTHDPAHLFDGIIFYPFTRTLAVTDHQLTHAALGALVLPLLNPAAFHNALLLFSFAASGFTMYVLARRLTGSELAGVVAGCAFAFSTFRFLHLRHQHVLATEAVPLAMLAVLLAVERPSRRRLLATAGGVALVLYSSWHMAIIGGLAVLIVAAMALAAAGGPVLARALRLAAPVLLVALPLIPLAAVYVEVISRWHQRPAGVYENVGSMSAMSTDVPALLSLPDEAKTPYATVTRRLGTGEAKVFPGVALTALAVWGFAVACRTDARGDRAGRARPRRRALLAVASVLLAAALVAALDLLPTSWTRAVTSVSPVTIAALLIGWWTVLSARDPAASPVWRVALTACLLVLAGAMLSFGPRIMLFGADVGTGVYRPDLLPIPLPIRAPARFALLVSIGFALLAALAVADIRTRSPWKRAGVVAAVLVALNVDVRVAPLDVEQVPRFAPIYRWLAVLDEPGAVVEYPENSWAVYQSLMAGRRTVNGLAYVYPDTHPRAMLPPDLEPPQLSALWEDFHPRFLVLRAGFYPPTERARVLAAAAELGEALTLRKRIGDDYVFELRDRQAGNPLVRRWPRWLLERDAPNGVHVGGRITAVPEDARPVLSLLWNGEPMSGLEAPDGRFDQRVPVRWHGTRPGLDVLEIIGDYQRVGGSRRYPVGDTGHTIAADVIVAADRDDGWIQVNGRSVAARKGYLLVTLDATGRRIEAVERFNTSWMREESDRLASVVEALPTGTPVLLSSQFDVSRELTERAVDALRSLGFDVDLRGRFGTLHAGIGVKGARRGTALERTGTELTVLALGRAVTPRVELDRLELN